MGAIASMSWQYPCWINLNSELDIPGATAQYQAAAQQGTLPVQEVAFSPSIDATPQYAETIVSGSLRMTWAGKTLVDRGVGRIDTDISYATGAGTQVGTLSYGTGLLIPTVWTAGAGNTAIAFPYRLSAVTGTDTMGAIAAAAVGGVFGPRVGV
jgi:hypothetical protein